MRSWRVGAGARDGGAHAVEEAALFGLGGLFGGGLLLGEAEEGALEGAARPGFLARDSGWGSG